MNLVVISVYEMTTIITSQGAERCKLRFLAPSAVGGTEAARTLLLALAFLRPSSVSRGLGFWGRLQFRVRARVRVRINPKS